MPDAAYVIGTREYVLFELEVDSPGAAFLTAEWTAEAALCPLAEPFDSATATWHPATLETVGGRHYAKLLAGVPGGLEPVAGTYKGFLRLTKVSGGTEIPLIAARGSVLFGRG